jgi:hypothetical protein
MPITNQKPTDPNGSNFPDHFFHPDTKNISIEFSTTRYMQEP